MSVRSLSVHFLLMLTMITGYAHASVSGFVRDGKMNPVEGALVTFTNESDPGEICDAVTSATGSYAITLTTSVDETRPETFALGQNFPNPFNPSTTIPYILDHSAFVELSVFNISGQRIATLVSDHMSAGSHAAVWNGYAADGSHVASGLYIYRLTVDGHPLTGKMTLLDGGAGGGAGTATASGMTLRTAKTASVTYRATVTGDDIEPYEQSGINLTDGMTLDFTVTRKAVEPIKGRYTMPKNIKETGQFFDFSTGTSTDALSAIEAWDIAFDNAMMGLGIDLNFGKASRAFNTGLIDFDTVTHPDDPSDDEFILDAPWGDPSAVAIDSWFDMPQMGVIESQMEVYLIACRGEEGTEYHKFQITGFSDGVYSFRFARLPDGVTIEATVAKDGDANWKYYSFSENAEIAYEPPADSWDLYFGPTFFVMGDMGYMPVGKIIPNTGSGVEMTVAADTALAGFTLGDWPRQLTTMYEVPDWYTLSGGMPPTYEYPIQTFLVKTTEGRYAAFQILSYKSAGVSGFPTFDFKYNWEK